MTITYRDEKGVDLTPAEVDQNFREIVDPKENNSTAIPAGGLVDIPSHTTNILNVRPSGSSTAIYAANLAIATLENNSIEGAGHIIGQFGVVRMKKNCSAAYAVEGRVEALQGHTGISACFIAASESDAGGASGTIELHADFLSNNFDDHNHITQKFTLLNVDPNKVLKTAGEAIIAEQKVVPRQQISTALNRYYPIAGIASFSDAPTVRGFAIVAPFISPGRVTYNRIGCLLQTGVVNGEGRMGIYADENGLPGDLILDAGTISLLSGEEGEREITINQQLEAGAYWLAIKIDGDAEPSLKWAQVHSYNTTGMISPSTQHSFVFKAATGELPASMSDGDWFENTSTPLVWLRQVS